eukprot:2337554-Pleurochrysis_carterae.AAC.2
MLWLRALKGTHFGPRRSATDLDGHPLDLAVQIAARWYASLCSRGLSPTAPPRTLYPRRGPVRSSKSSRSSANLLNLEDAGVP